MDSTLITTIVAIALILFIGLILWTQNKRKKISSNDLKKIRQHWEKVEKNIKQDPKGGVIEADKILDEALKIKGYQGSVGEKLKKAGPLFKNENNVWNAHKLRNRIAHELNIEVSEGNAKIALSQFKQGLKDLGFKL